MMSIETPLLLTMYPCSISSASFESAQAFGEDHSSIHVISHASIIHTEALVHRNEH
jgi:hypothetical protein